MVAWLNFFFNTEKKKVLRFWKWLFTSLPNLHYTCTDPVAPSLSVPSENISDKPVLNSVLLLQTVVQMLCGTDSSAQKTQAWKTHTNMCEGVCRRGRGRQGKRIFLILTNCFLFFPFRTFPMPIRKPALLHKHILVKEPSKNLMKAMDLILRRATI